MFKIKTLWVWVVWLLVSGLLAQAENGSAPVDRKGWAESGT